jgi:hypothetical protein
LPFATTVNPVTVNHAIRRDATTLLGQVLRHVGVLIHSESGNRSFVQTEAGERLGRGFEAALEFG